MIRRAIAVIGWYAIASEPYSVGFNDEFCMISEGIGTEEIDNRIQLHNCA